MQLSVREFLDSISNKHTRKEYRYGIKKFSDWFDKTPEEILQIRKDDLTPRPDENIIEAKHRAKRFERKIEQFHAHLLEQGYAINSARTSTLGIRQLFRYYQMPIQMRTGSKISKTVKTTKSFPLRIEHVRDMFNVADLRERVLLATATDLAMRISDFRDIKKSDLPDLNQEPPIPFDVMTSKEDVVAHGFLSAETVELLKIYIQTIENMENPYLFPSNGKRPISEDRINSWLKKLAEKSGINTQGKRLSFHCFRKMFLSASIDSGIGLIAGKKMCGKAIPKSDDTYLTSMKLREKFIQLKKVLMIQQALKPENHERLEQLQRTVANQQMEVKDLETRLEALTQEQGRLNEIVSVLVPKKVERHLLTDEGEKVWIEEFGTPEEYIQAEKKFRAMLFDRQRKMKRKRGRSREVEEDSRRRKE